MATRSATGCAAAALAVLLAVLLLITSPTTTTSRARIVAASSDADADAPVGSVSPVGVGEPGDNTPTTTIPSGTEGLSTSSATTSEQSHSGVCADIWPLGHRSLAIGAARDDAAFRKRFDRRFGHPWCAKLKARYRRRQHASALAPSDRLNVERCDMLPECHRSAVVRSVWAFAGISPPAPNPVLTAVAAVAGDPRQPSRAVRLVDSSNWLAAGWHAKLSPYMASQLQRVAAVAGAVPLPVDDVRMAANTTLPRLPRGSVILAADGTAAATPRSLCSAARSNGSSTAANDSTLADVAQRFVTEAFWALDSNSAYPAHHFEVFMNFLGRYVAKYGMWRSHIGGGNDTTPHNASTPSLDFERGAPPVLLYDSQRAGKDTRRRLRSIEAWLLVLLRVPHVRVPLHTVFYVDRVHFVHSPEIMGLTFGRVSPCQFALWADAVVPLLDAKYGKPRMGGGAISSLTGAPAPTSAGAPPMVVESDAFAAKLLSFVVPQQLAWLRNRTAAAAADDSAHLERVAAHFGSDNMCRRIAILKTSEKRGHRRFAFTDAFVDLASKWRYLLLLDATPMELRAHCINHAEWAMLSWGSTSTLNMMLYGRRSRVLRLVLLYHTGYLAELAEELDIKGRPTRRVEVPAASKSYNHLRMAYRLVVRVVTPTGNNLSNLTDADLDLS